jgi:NADP-dependent 3-hydroxy acid dehydrogenase YdfG
VIAVVTGAGSGIGAALCRELARGGGVVVGADIDAARVSELCTAIRIAGGRAEHAVVDVTSAGAVEQLAADTAARHHRIDLWINNAGIAIGGATEVLRLDDWRRVLDVNLAGVVHGIHAAYPRMLAQRSGHIVNVASVAGLAPYPLALPYTTSKHAVVGLSLALRAEAAAHGVRVSVACPGMIRTPIWERSTVRGELGRGRAQLLGRVTRAMTAERCAALIAHGISRDRAIIPITVEARIAWWLARLSPALAARIGQQIATYARRLSGAVDDCPKKK